jgi:hypothetical protein
MVLGLVNRMQSQNEGMVTISSTTPSIICEGQSVTLSANVNLLTQVPVVDFETGDFSQANFNNTSSRPWVINTTKPHTGSKCMKSNCAGINSVSSVIQATVNVPHDGVVSFWVRVSSEANYDKFYFYIDDVQQGSALSGELAYTYLEFPVTQGNHIYKWEYKKDNTVNSGDDCVYVDDITLYEDAIPASNVMNYDFETNTLQGWSTIDADGDGHNWMLGSELMPLGFTGHNGSDDIVVSQSYESNGSGQGTVLYPDNYLVSPYKINVKQGASISFYACAQDEEWANEHFGVAVSTESNTNASHFTTIWEKTLTAKDSGQSADVSRSGDRTMGSWYHYTVSLNAYVGQCIWVAIRHFNVSDMFYLDVDDITIKSGNSNTSSDITYHWDPVNQNDASITVTPTVTTTYTVTAYSHGYSLGTAQRTIWVDNSSMSLTAEPDTICAGEEVTLKAEYLMASVGDILCSDGSIVKPSEWPVAGKTAKGVVFYVDPIGQHGWAVNVAQQQKTWCNKTNVTVAGLSQYTNWLSALTDMDGSQNTQAIHNAATSTVNYPAITYVMGLESIGGHSWYLPAVGQLNVLIGVFLTVNQSLQTVGGTPIPYTTTAHIWSSTEGTGKYAMMVQCYNGMVGYDLKSKSNYVRAIIDF